MKAKNLGFWQMRVMCRDGFRCRFLMCNEENNILAHHIESRSQSPELALEVDNGVTLCTKHHGQAHSGYMSIKTLKANLRKVRGNGIKDGKLIPLRISGRTVIPKSEVERLRKEEATADKNQRD